MSTTPGPTGSPRPSSGLVYAVPGGGEPEGWATEYDAARAGWRTRTLAEPEPWRTDPWLSYHIALALEQGLVGDLNPVQRAVLMAGRILRRDEEGARREAAFIDLMFVSNQQMYQTYTTAKKREEMEAGVEWRSPQTVEELLALAQEIGRVASSEGGWEVAASEHAPTDRVVDSPFEESDLAGMAD